MSCRIIYCAECSRCSTENVNVYVPMVSGRPERVTMGVGFNPLQCDTRLCWVKQAESDGWIRFRENVVNRLSPECENRYGLPWEDVNLRCAQAQQDVTS